MNSFFKQIAALRSNRRAVTALEYGLIAALIAGVVIAGASTLGNNLNSLFGEFASKINSIDPNK